jgi:DNA-binding protein YbaB
MRSLAAPDRLLGQYREATAGLTRLGEQLGDLTVTARSRDGSVTAVVDARGALIDLDIDPARAGRLDARAVGARVLEAATAAAAEARTRSAAAVSALLPEPLRRAIAPDGTVDIGRLLPDPADLGGAR